MVEVIAVSKSKLDKLNLAQLSEEQLAILEQAENTINRNRKDPVFLMALCD